MTTNSIQRYYQEVEKLKQRGGTKMESTVSQVFYTLLNDYAQQKELMLVPQVWVKGKLGRKVKPDGTLKDSLRQDWGLEQFRKCYCHSVPQCHPDPNLSGEESIPKEKKILQSPRFFRMTKSRMNLKIGTLYECDIIRFPADCESDSTKLTIQTNVIFPTGTIGKKDMFS
jgi:hypothetical protein